MYYVGQNAAKTLIVYKWTQKLFAKYIFGYFFLTTSVKSIARIHFCITKFNFDLPSTVLKERSDAFVHRYELV